MKIEIENNKLTPAINFLYDLKLTRKHSRFRRRFIAKLTAQVKAVEAERKELIEEYAVKDNEGNPVIEDNQYSITDMNKLNEDLIELMGEHFVLDSGNDLQMLRTVKAILQLQEDEEYDGETSEIYDYLYEKFEELEGEND